MTIEANVIKNQIDIRDRNTDIPFTPSYTYSFLEADKDTFFKIPFHWIQAFFVPTGFTANPELVIYGGELNANNSKQGSLVRFAYSGERIKIKGLGILSTAADCRGVTVTSIPIGGATNASFSKVIAWGGAY